MAKSMIDDKTYNASLVELKNKLKTLNISQQQKLATGMLSRASLPIRKAAKRGALAKVNPKKKRFIMTRGSSKYIIEPRTLERSIGVIYLRRAHLAMVDVGYRRRGKYDGWFALFVDAGTDYRSTKRTRGGGQGAYRGFIEPRNIMEDGIKGMAQAEQKLRKEVAKLIKKLDK
jgi:hypothetical protein